LEIQRDVLVARPAIGNRRFRPGRCFVGASVRKD
jgi:hypothetical protein